ncbi:MAG: winged helix-turn-helix transcriptional regulator [Candidatus Aenigmarchaeota archaeon]|nr:winged helix-turn-helix transcriptional regulator [Candidatus Aenigmarchaeota archaeon]
METIDVPTMKAIATSTRKEIVRLLRNRPYTASELSRILGKHVTTISEHMGILEKSGLISRKDGSKWVYYNLTRKGENLFRSNYSWAVMLSMFFLIAAAGTYLYASQQGVFMARGTVTGAQEAASAAQKAESADQSAEPAGQSPPAEPPAPEPMNPDLILGLVLAFIGITGIVYAAIRNLRAKTLRNVQIS